MSLREQNASRSLTRPHVHLLSQSYLSLSSKDSISLAHCQSVSQSVSQSVARAKLDSQHTEDSRYHARATFLGLDSKLEQLRSSSSSASSRSRSRSNTGSSSTRTRARIRTTNPSCRVNVCLLRKIEINSGSRKEIQGLQGSPDSDAQKCHTLFLPLTRSPLAQPLRLIQFQ